MATPVRGSMTGTMPLAAELLGRRAELAGLTELFDGPGGTAMVVLGEAGSGKTALLEGPGVPALRRKWFSTGGHYGSRMSARTPTANSGCHLERRPIVNSQCVEERTS
jgi:hypothetical protein